MQFWRDFHHYIKAFGFFDYQQLLVDRTFGKSRKSLGFTYAMGAYANELVMDAFGVKLDFPVTPKACVFTEVQEVTETMQREDIENDWIY